MIHYINDRMNPNKPIRCKVNIKTMILWEEKHWRQCCNSAATACMPRHCGLNPGTTAPRHKESVGASCEGAPGRRSGAGIGTRGQEVAALPGSADTGAFSLNLVLGNTPSQGEYRHHFISHCNNNWFRKESSINAKMIDIYTLKYLPIRYMIITMGKMARSLLRYPS